MRTAKEVFLQLVTPLLKKEGITNVEKHYVDTIEDPELLEMMDIVFASIEEGRKEAIKACVQAIITYPNKDTQSILKLIGEIK